MVKQNIRNDPDEIIEKRHATYPQRVAFSPYGMVASGHDQATRAGVAVLEEGGNAMDAAVAVAFALGVCEPAASGLGGQTMMLLYDASRHRSIVLDGSSRAPNRATPGLLSREQRQYGHRATTLPSTPAVLEYARRTYGTLPLERLLEPAVVLAGKGYHLSKLQNRLTRRKLKPLRAGPAGNLFLKSDGKPFSVGSVLRQPILSETLSRLVRKGIEDFYKGEIAREIHEDMVKNGGLLHLDELARIPWPIERRPISCRFNDWRILTFPPPGAGRR